MQTTTQIRIGNTPNLTQEGRVLAVLKEANGQWVSKRYFVQTMMLSQAGRALKNLQDDPRWQQEYAGYELESSRQFKLTDEYGFVFYRLRAKDTLF